MIGMTLGWLNGSQLAGSFVLLAMAERLQRGSWPFTVFGPLTVLGLARHRVLRRHLDRRIGRGRSASPPQ